MSPIKVTGFNVFELPHELIHTEPEYVIKSFQLPLPEFKPSKFDP